MPHGADRLFAHRRPPRGVTVLTLTVTVAVLVVNAAARDATLSMTLAGLGAALLLISRACGRRLPTAASAWVLVIVALALTLGAALSSHADAIVEVSARLACGVIWVLWLGTMVDWASLREILLGLRVPHPIVGHLDLALLHGVVTQRDWIQRRDAARQRLGSSRLPIAAWGPLIGAGAQHAFTRLERVDENAQLRSASGGDDRARLSMQLEHVDVERNGNLVLEQVSLRIEPSEWILVCGPSGAGKSSLLRLLAGLDGAARGSMTRFGDPISPGAPLRTRLDGRVALLGQNPEHHLIASTVAEDIEWGMLHRGSTPTNARRRCVEMAEALHIDHLLQRPCHALSFGEQRRVALAGILVLEPALLLLDEPTAGLDPVAAQELCALVERTVKRTAAACLWATHDLHLVPPPARRTLLLRDRRVIFDGSTAQGLTKPWLTKAGLAV
ncbi:MAG: ABC transporter ATP-binding protein [Myxococcales bacterium FL481]|nr:MAG: ABC transporter ATP-binding protein [Myxococcales bacterium FL481]